MLIMLYVNRNVHEISIRKTLQTFSFYSTKKLEDLLGTFEILKISYSIDNISNMFFATKFQHVLSERLRLSA